MVTSDNEKEHPLSNIKEEKVFHEILLAEMGQSELGMGRYHQSEILHKQDAIAIMKTIFAGIGGLIVAGLSARFASSINPFVIITVTFLAISYSIFAAWRIAAVTNDKILADAVRYAEFKAVNIRVAQILGLYEPVETADGNIAPREEPKESVGAGLSRKILDQFFWLILIFGVVGWIAILVVLGSARNSVSIL